MDLYYAVIDTTVVALTFALDADKARDQLELALAEEGEYETDDMDVVPFRRSDGTVVLNLRDLR